MRGSPVRVTGDWAYQWELVNFNPLPDQHPSTDRQKFVTTDYIQRRTALPNLAKMRPQWFLAK